MTQLQQSWLIPDARTETRGEAMARGRRILQLIMAIEKAPAEEEGYRDMQASLEWFIRAAKERKFNEDSRDGLCRLIGGDVEELDCCEKLTQADYRKMRQNKRIWKKAIPGHLAYPEGGSYCTTMHPKEIAALETLAAQCEYEAEVAREVIAKKQRELDELRAVCPLPKAVAERLDLTTDGFRVAPAGRPA